MTEEEWLAATDPVAMLEYHRAQMSGRKLRLFLVGCCRQLWDSLFLEEVRTAVEVNERFADKQATSKELTKARNAANGPVQLALDGCHGQGQPMEETVLRSSFAIFVAQETRELRYAIMHRLRDDPLLGQITPTLLRDIFGNPFRPITLDPSWLTSTVLSLATGPNPLRMIHKLLSVA
jgi:hypothetical protein